MICNSVVSTRGAKYAAFDVGDFYLETPLDEYEYVHENAIRFIFTMDKRPIKYGQTCIQRICILGNKEGNLWSSPDRSPSKQAAASEFETAWPREGTRHTSAHIMSQEKL